MKTKHATARIAQIEAHNDRVQTIRNKSLSDEAVTSIDQMIEKADYLFGDIMESLYSGCAPCLTTDELVEFKSAIDNLRKHFTQQEINEYLLHQAEIESNWDDE